MALRVLMGIIMTNQNTGRATISFSPHAVDGDGRGVGLVEYGPIADFRDNPGAHVSLREIDVGDDGKAKVNHHRHTPELLEVGWSGAAEIAYIIVGEVEEA